ncbi:MAG TPA: type II secretion system F family protein [Vicinamibacterales bacterium]|nr:type II secretion system F family protein [Vicinamibacterales bacterium]
MILPIVGVTFLLCFTSIFGAYWLFILRPEQRSLGIVRRRMSSPIVKASLQRQLVKQEQALSSIGAFDRLLRRSEERTQSLKTLFEQAGVKTNVGTILAAAGLLALVASYAAVKVSGWFILGPPVAALAAMIPFTVLKRLRTRRMNKLEEQFPEAIDLIGRALRAGHALTTGIDMVATEMPAPIGEEFRILYDQQNYGMAFPDALRHFAQRIPVLDAKFFVTAVLIQRESGGNLAEVLDNLASVIRERFRVKRQMRVASAHGRITGWVLVCLPPVLGAVLMTVNREHRELMFGETLGIQMMVGAAILQGIGTLIIRKIINIPY